MSEKRERVFIFPLFVKVEQLEGEDEDAVITKAIQKFKGYECIQKLDMGSLYTVEEFKAMRERSHKLEELRRIFREVLNF